jgi:hypothetical protein
MVCKRSRLLLRPAELLSWRCGSATTERIDPVGLPRAEGTASEATAANTAATEASSAERTALRNETTKGT